jgi:3-oxoacyl-[acyl-carrier protein] reductase
MTEKKVAIIGGSSKGLGFAAAASLAQAGYIVVITGRNKINLDIAHQKIKDFGGEVFSMVCDITSKNDNQVLLNAVLQKFNRIDVLVLNSGGPKAGAYDVLSELDWIEGFNSVLLYNLRLSTMVIPYMKKQGWGRIINISSIVAKEPSPSLIISSVYRAGLAAFAKGISKDLIKYGITINTICPGAFMTDRAKELIKVAAQNQNKSEEEVQQANVSSLPMGRYQEPEELGDFVKYLCSDLAGSITGTTINIDGGISNTIF